MPADVEALHLDRVPALGQDHRTFAPGGRLSPAQLQAGETVEAAHQKSPQVGHEGAAGRLVRKAPAAELVRLLERLLDEVGEAPLEELERAGAVPEAGGEDALQG